VLTGAGETSRLNTAGETSMLNTAGGTPYVKTAGGTPYVKTAGGTAPRGTSAGGTAPRGTSAGGTPPCTYSRRDTAVYIQQEGHRRVHTAGGIPTVVQRGGGYPPWCREEVPTGVYTPPAPTGRARLPVHLSMLLALGPPGHTPAPAVRSVR